MKKQLLLTTILLTVIMSYAQTKIESSIEQNYNGSSYTNLQGSNYEYDGNGNGNLISESSFSWNSSEWIQSFKVLYTYNSNNKVTEELEQNWDGSQYVNSYRVLYTYNYNDLLTVILDQDWNNDQWENSYRTNVSYNSNEISDGISQEWNGSQWVNSDRSTFTYSGNNLTQVLNEDWNGTQWTSVDSDRDIFIYNANNKKTTYIIETWNGTSWDEEERTEYILDGSENRISETEIYNGSNQGKSEYNYDTSALLNNFSHPFKDKTGVDYIFEDFPYVNKITSQTILSYNSSTSNFDISGRITYDYDNPITLSTQNFEVINKVSIYPNPVNIYLNIKTTNAIKTIEIYNILGLKVRTSNSTKINMEQLSDGVYTIKIIDIKGNKSIKKFIKK